MRLVLQVFACGQGLGGCARAVQHRLHGAQGRLYVRLFIQTGRSCAVARFLQDAEANLNRQIA